MSIDRDNLSKNLKNIKFDDELYTIQSGLIDFIDNSEISRDLLGEHRKSLTYDINRIENAICTHLGPDPEPRSAFRDPETDAGLRDPGSGSRIHGPGSWILHPGSCIFARS